MVKKLKKLFPYQILDDELFKFMEYLPYISMGEINCKHGKRNPLSKTTGFFSSFLMKFCF